MSPVRGGVSAASAYATIGKEMSFLVAYFRLKLKRLSIGPSKDLCQSAPVERCGEPVYSFILSPFLAPESPGKSFITFPV